MPRPRSGETASPGTPVSRPLPAALDGHSKLTPRGGDPRVRLGVSEPAPPRRNRIEELRLSRGLTHVRLAERLGTTAGAIRQLEAGTRKLTLDWIERLSSGLECDRTELLRRSESGPVVGHVDPDGVVAWTAQTDPPRFAPAPPGIDPEYGAALAPDPTRPATYHSGYYYFHRGAFGGIDKCLYRLSIVQLVGGCALLRVVTPSVEVGCWNIHGLMSPPVNGVEIEWAAAIEWFKPNRIRGDG